MASTFTIFQEGKLKDYDITVDLHTDGDAEIVTCMITWTDSDGNTGSQQLDTDKISSYTIHVSANNSISIIISRVEISYYHNEGEAECCNPSVYVECNPPLTWSESAYDISGEISGEYPGGNASIYGYGEIC